jgi:DME family drug/metabolite transporter
MSPAFLGSLCGAISAVGYTAANIHLRQAAGCDPMLVTCVKSVPTVIVAGLIVAGRRWKGVRDFDHIHSVIALIGFGLIGQWVGNVGFQWCLGIIGLAMTVPLTMGSIILTGAIVGRIWLHEPIRPRSAAAILILLAAIASLGAGSWHASQTMAHRVPPSVGLVIAAVGASFISGLAYTLLSAGIRVHARGKVSLPATLFTVCTTGLVSLGIWCVARLGPEEIFSPSTGEFAAMLAAGIWNFIAFFALVKALQLATMVHVNALNSSQIALASLAGVAWFGERATPYLVIGVALTILGLLTMDHRGHR